MTAQGKKVCAGDPRGPPCWPLLSSRISSGMEAWVVGEWTLPLTIDIRLCARFLVTVTAGGSCGYNPYPGHKEPEEQRGDMTNAKVGQEMATLSA